MLVVVCYDVSLLDDNGRRRLRRISKHCLDYGQRVQFSTYECIVDPAQWITLRNKLIEEMDVTVDSLRFYFLGKHWEKRIESVGKKKAIDQEEPLIL